MKRSDGTPIDGTAIRLAFLAVAMFFAIGHLALSLHDIQVRNAERYVGQQDATSFRRVRLPATRGRIFDRNGFVLADNRARYCAVLYIEELRAPGSWSNTVARVEEQIARVSEILGRPSDIGNGDIWAHLMRRRPIPLVAFRDLSDSQLARLCEWPEPLPGVDVAVEQERVYPWGDSACHIIGYVGKGKTENPVPSEENLDEEPEAFDFFLPDIEGRSGMEKAFDRVLRGSGGGEMLRIDAVGYKRGVVPGRAPVPGSDIALTLDMALQRDIEEMLGDRCGAAVVLDAHNGDILALASAPRYDLSLFAGSVRPEDWEEVSSRPGAPFLHRALSGRYAPGSVVKPLVALAALSAGAISTDTSFNCEGYVVANGVTNRCSARWGHGWLDVREALSVSCNPFFIKTGLEAQWEPTVRDAFAAVGFGVAPKLGISANSGLLPSDAWKRGKGRGGWLSVDTAQVSMGQGDMLATPFQVAQLAMALANDGEIIEPRLVRDQGDGVTHDERVVRTRLPWAKHDIATVRAGMIDAVEAHNGTAQAAAVPGLSVAGKTGTAQYRVAGDPVRHKHSWMIAYAPANAPRYAMAVVIEDSEGGGKSAAPVVHSILEKLFPEFAAPIEPEEDEWDGYEYFEPEIPEPTDETLDAPEVAEEENPGSETPALEEETAQELFPESAEEPSDESPGNLEPQEEESEA